MRKKAGVPAAGSNSSSNSISVPHHFFVLYAPVCLVSAQVDGSFAYCCFELSTREVFTLQSTEVR